MIAGGWPGLYKSRAAAASAAAHRPSTAHRTPLVASCAQSSDSTGVTYLALCDITPGIPAGQLSLQKRAHVPQGNKQAKQAAFGMSSGSVSAALSPHGAGLWGLVTPELKRRDEDSQ